MRKLLKQHYPWIIDVARCESTDRYEYVKPVNIIIDIEEFLQSTNFELESWALSSIERTGEFEALYLQVAVTKDYVEDAKEIGDDIESIMRKVHLNPAIPKDLKAKQTPSIHVYILTTK